MYDFLLLFNVFVLIHNSDGQKIGNFFPQICQQFADKHPITSFASVVLSGPGTPQGFLRGDFQRVPIYFQCSSIQECGRMSRSGPRSKWWLSELESLARKKV